MHPAPRRFLGGLSAVAVLGLLIATVQNAFATTTTPNAAWLTLSAPAQIDDTHPGLSVQINLPKWEVPIQMLASTRTVGYRGTRPFTLAFYSAAPAMLYFNSSSGQGPHYATNFTGPYQLLTGVSNSEPWKQTSETVWLAAALDGSNKPSRLMIANQSTQAVQVDLIEIW